MASERYTSPPKTRGFEQMKNSLQWILSAHCTLVMVMIDVILAFPNSTFTTCAE